MRILWVLIVAVMFVACTKNNNFVTESGVEVTCLAKGEGDSLMKDSIAVFYMKLVVGEDEEVLIDATAEKPMPLAYDQDMKAGHVQEVVGNLQVGDSVYFETTAKNLFAETYQRPIPPNFSEDDIVKVNMKLVDQMSRENYMTYAQELQAKAQTKAAELLKEKSVTDAEDIDAYLDSLEVEPQISESGIRYVITEEGSGPKAEAGDSVTVHYDGKLLNGEPFDSSRDRDQPFTFMIGRGQVIPGWDEGITFIPEGGKGTLYIPSPLAYGSRSPSPKIPAYSILVFDVEVIDVKKQN